MLRVIYRYCSRENGKTRPRFYSKALSFRSLVKALHAVDEYMLVVLADGPIPKQIADELLGSGELRQTSVSGNSSSFMEAVRIAGSFAQDDLVYFVEDDYLHMPDSLRLLVEASREIEADYFTLYDHPVRYLPYDNPLGDCRLRDYRLYAARNHHWQTVESTCMTFAARLRTLTEDQGVFAEHVAEDAIPRDRDLFRHLQGIGPYATCGERRRLVGPVPSLATHCELPWLAPIVDWNRVAIDCH